MRNLFLFLILSCTNSNISDLPNSSSSNQNFVLKNIVYEDLFLFVATTNLDVNSMILSENGTMAFFNQGNPLCSVTLTSRDFLIDLSADVDEIPQELLDLIGYVSGDIIFNIDNTEEINQESMDCLGPVMNILENNPEDLSVTVSADSFIIDTIGNEAYTEGSIMILD